MAPVNRKLYQGVGLFTIIFILIAIRYYADFLFRLPYGLHDEAQADRLAVAIQYFDRCMNFFLPRTYHIYATDGITPIEFPIHPYLAALLGKIFGRDSISTIYKLITLSSVYAGLLCLHLASFKVSKNILLSLFVPLLVFTSPVFAYYACNYMPDGAATSISFIGFYFFLRFYEEKQFSHYIKAIVFLTLATLIKTSVGVILISVISYSVFDMLFIKSLELAKRRKTLLVVYGISLALIAYNYLYNSYLADKYHGYIFLLRINPFSGWEEMKMYFTYCVTDKFANEYFTIAHYPVIFLIMASGITSIYLNRSRKHLLLLIGLMYLGSFLLTLLFGAQLIHHHYYFVSMWIPTITLSVLLCFNALAESYNGKRSVFISATLAVIVVLFFYGNRYYNKIINMDETTYPGLQDIGSVRWMPGGDKLLDSLGVGKDSTIAFLDENPANVGLLYFDRRGFNIMKGSWEGNLFNVTSYMQDLDIDIMICDAKKVPKLVEDYPYFYDVFEEVYRDDKKAIYHIKEQ